MTRFDRNLARVARTTILVCSDVLTLLVSAGLAYALWALPAREQPAGLYLQLAPLLILFIVGYGQAALYPAFGLGPVETLRRISFVTTFGFLVLAAFYFALKLPHLYSRVTFVLTFVFSLILVPLGRVVVVHWARRWAWWTEPVVVIGTGQRAIKAIHSIRQSRHIGYRPVAAVSLNGQLINNDVAEVPIVTGIEQIPSLTARGIRVALLETDQFRDLALVDTLQQSFRHVVLLREYDDLPVEGLQIRNLGELVGIEYTNNLLLHGNRVLKRSLDLLIGGIGLILTAPIVLCAAALVRLTDGGPAFFFHERSGLNGRRIAVPKIRTMRVDAEKRLEEYLRASPALREEWQTRFKLVKDPRLIPIVGRFLRRFSLDELPQLWSVVGGRMSLVGPRPFPDYHIGRFPQTFRELRSRVRPGITGLWQISVRSGGGIDEQRAYDSYYIRNWSVWLDLYILSRTIAAVLTGRGAY